MNFNIILWARCFEFRGFHDDVSISLSSARSELKNKKAERVHSATTQSNRTFCCNTLTVDTKQKSGSFPPIEHSKTISIHVNTLTTHTYMNMYLCIFTSASISQQQQHTAQNKNKNNVFVFSCCPLGAMLLLIREIFIAADRKKISIFNWCNRLFQERYHHFEIFHFYLYVSMCALRSLYVYINATRAQARKRQPNTAS